MTKATRTDATGVTSARLGNTGKLLFIFVLTMGAALVLFGWEDAVTVSRQIGLVSILALCGLAALHYAIRAARWHMLVRAHGVASGLAQNMRHFFGGFAMTATPGRVGELVRLRWLQNETGVRFSKLVPIALADRAVELAAMLLLILGTLAVSNVGTRGVWGLLAVTSVLIVLSCRPQILEVLLMRLWLLLDRRKPRLFVRMRRVLRDLAPIMHVRVLVPLLLIGSIGWAIEGFAFWLLLGWLDIPLSFATATAIFLVAVLAGALSGLPGGFGGTEATGIALLVLQSIPVESAVIAIVIIRLTTLWFAVLIGLVTFPFAEAYASAKTTPTPDQGKRNVII